MVVKKKSWLVVFLVVLGLFVPVVFADWGISDDWSISDDWAIAGATPTPSPTSVPTPSPTPTSTPPYFPTPSPTPYQFDPYLVPEEVEGFDLITVSPIFMVVMVIGVGIAYFGVRKVMGKKRSKYGKKVLKWGL